MIVDRRASSEGFNGCTFDCEGRSDLGSGDAHDVKPLYLMAGFQFSSISAWAYTRAVECEGRKSPLAVHFLGPSIVEQA